jgi:tetratricopeptide (TPR) repeat protein
MNADYFVEKLRDRVREAPESKLFLTLAEELKKRGEIGEAFAVLKEGIGKNPSFAAARLTLGRWYLNDDKLDAAEREFSEVLRISPDDRFALRYIKEIEDKNSAGKGDAGHKIIERLNQFQQAIHKRFKTATPGNNPAGDR